MKLEAVIGLEIHVQISTKTKMFCGCNNDSFEAAPNVNTCQVCMGYPGQLPVLNSLAVKKGVTAALALNCKINNISKFDRKNYFYPDNPKGFQISQYDEPLAEHGSLEIDVEGEKKEIKITRLHLEDDAGKLTHTTTGSLLDFNRAGTPLMEIVSEPDIRSAKEASAYAKTVQQIMRYVGSSEADMEKGMLRFDASVSLRPVGDDKLYPRTEIKNLNSFRFLEAAIDYEIKRQTAMWEENKIPDSQATVGFDPEKGKTYFLREKEGSADYRYFPEPDIPPVEVTENQINEYQKAIPTLPQERKKNYIEELKIDEDDARILSENLKLAQYFEEVVAISNSPQKSSAIIKTVLLKHLNEEFIEVDQQKITSKMLGELMKMVEEGAVSYNLAKGEIFNEMYETGKTAETIIEEKGLKQVDNKEELEAICQEVIDKNPDPVNDVKAGKEKAIGFLVGQVMKLTQGKANPEIVNEILKNMIK
ncbi:Asp-tRNA(Asn)/Glu-tRNA(Gln) amidotransferase GatCAB subunit B [Candidatus Peregrinibacteria bacterium HGW-Peregrinibacteria-1]|jgi:aspartyl-tRNA(Asn)/glutamyl-tRNA(Gln) amidotransferase subunit B|nr:MAG: Asp-tRNA(Asn)/Glu-tRNA(Gln) amidotransferase GatCAB subunit B [Candidatus Peregrinibacteria bacterium HGW-Peregrinibacteria-1]